MSIESQRESEGENKLPPGAAAAHAGLRHGSSKMLESYLGDIEYLMREQLWTGAAPLALALPYICTALGNGDLVSSREAYRDWCEVWMRPPQDDTSMSVPSPDEVYRMAEERGVEPKLARGVGVPAGALRQLRLRRLSRAAPPRRRISPSDVNEASDEPVREACDALLGAVRRWYGDWAARAATVQTNLARLAVLR
jgi:hypothetical protein